MYTMMSLLFLLLGVVLIASIVMSVINPYDQVAFANVEKLRASMNQACLGGDATLKFSLPQNTPMLTGLFPVLPQWQISTNGDPNYVLYYESFPPGEAVGWEIYQNMQNRIVVYLPDRGEGMTQDDVMNYVKDVINKAKQKNVGLVEGAVVGNIVVDKTRSDFYMGEKGGDIQAATNEWQARIKEDSKKYGDWSQKTADTGMPADGDNYFKFNSYVTLNSFEKSSIKYESCGENSLCLKTRGGVYRFPLSQCSNIKGVQMVYDARNRKAVYGAAGLMLTAVGAVAAIAGGGTVAVGAAVPVGATPIAAGVYEIGGTAILAEGGTVTGVSSATAASGGVLSWIGNGLKSLLGFGWSKSPTAIITGGSYSVYSALSAVSGALVSYKTQDFNIESPCEIKEMTVTRAKCVSDLPLDWGVDQKACAVDKVISYKIFQYGSDGKLHAVGQHYTCAEKVNNDIDTMAGGSYGSDDYCLQVKVTEKASGFCWTPDPYKDSFWSSNIDTQFIARNLKLTPVHDTLAYIDAANSPAGDVYSFVLKIYDIGKAESLREWAARKLSWGWPG